MLLELAQWLAKDMRVFNVFNYITLRAVLSCLTALAISLILGPCAGGTTPEAATPGEPRTTKGTRNGSSCPPFPFGGLLA